MGGPRAEEDPVTGWNAFVEGWLPIPGTGITLDVSDMGAISLAGMDAALEAMARLEAGAVANPDEHRQVGHYWLRDPDLAPSTGISNEIRTSWTQVDETVRLLRSAVGVDSILHLGIGGSALGPQLLKEALARPGHGLVRPSRYRIMDNTDPDGFEDALRGLDLHRTGVLVVSKSGGTVETRNAMLRVQAAFHEAGVPWAERAVAITGTGSALHRQAQAERWLPSLPLWDWVGGRTSVTGPVGLLPAALLGIPTAEFLSGAARMDVATRGPAARNPACLLAGCWRAAQVQGRRAMVVLPYADRLGALARYLQQLVMESLGKRLDRKGWEVREGLTVYGNKGSTDQHAYVQQLRDGPDDFFATFVAVLRPAAPDRILEHDVTAGDALHGFLAGTRAALAEDGKRSLTLELDALTPATLGALVALFERAVGIYAELLDLNAYHQPGVEAGKKAASQVLAAQGALRALLVAIPSTAEALAERAGVDPVLAWRVLHRLAVAGDRGVVQQGDHHKTATFRRG